MLQPIKTRVMHPGMEGMEMLQSDIGLFECDIAFVVTGAVNPQPRPTGRARRLVGSVGFEPTTSRAPRFRGASQAAKRRPGQPTTCHTQVMSSPRPLWADERSSCK